MTQTIQQSAASEMQPASPPARPKLGLRYGQGAPVQQARNAR